MYFMVDFFCFLLDMWIYIMLFGDIVVGGRWFFFFIDRVIKCIFFKFVVIVWFMWIEMSFIFKDDVIIIKKEFYRFFI